MKNNTLGLIVAATAFIGVTRSFIPIRAIGDAIALTGILWYVDGPFQGALWRWSWQGTLLRLASVVAATLLITDKLFTITPTVDALSIDVMLILLGGLGAYSVARWWTQRHGRPLP